MNFKTISLALLVSAVSFVSANENCTEDACAVDTNVEATETTKKVVVVEEAAPVAAEEAAADVVTETAAN